MVGVRTAALTVALLMPVAPAAAEPGVVDAQAGIAQKKVGSGYLVVVDCESIATPTVSTVTLEPPDVPLSTSITCSVNGALSSTATVPGAFAGTGLATVTPSVPRVCWHGSATFFDVDNGFVYTVSAPEECHENP